MHASCGAYTPRASRHVAPRRRQRTSHHRQDLHDGWQPTRPSHAPRSAWGLLSAFGRRLAALTRPRGQPAPSRAPGPNLRARMRPKRRPRGKAEERNTQISLFPPKQLRRPLRLARRVSEPVAQPVGLQCTQLSPRGQQSARQGAQGNARRDRQHTQIALFHPSSCGASRASRGAFQRPLRNPLAFTGLKCLLEADRTRARARSATPAATHFKRRLLSPTQAAVAPRAPRAARFSARCATC